MTGILAIETATDACSVAVYREGKITQRHATVPRQHSQLVFTMLDELLGHGNLKKQGIEVIAYGCGPGSFTGLRITASLVQGLAYSSNLPAIAVSTLAVMAQGALRKNLVKHNETVVCLLDARINEIYSATFGFYDGVAVLREGPFATAPGDTMFSDSSELVAVGNGCLYLDQLPLPLQARIRSSAPELLPDAADMFPLALDKLHRGTIQSARDVQPVYVRDEISWKKLAQQGRNV
jgi:tRNA threonylcarbamoyladenosine biosynthesis protein TsaB